MLPETIELSIFRIVQEGLSNVRRHSNASAVSVLLKHTSPRTLLVSIADNGSGITPDFDLSALSAPIQFDNPAIAWPIAGC
jgi:signal transduction histidine kinase